MPFTPFHFGPSALISLPLRKYLDVPVFILVNVAVDLEPLTIMVFDIPGTLHPYLHTFLIGGLAGGIFGYIVYRFKKYLKMLMNFLRLYYEPRMKIMILSGVLGVWLHVILDSLMHRDMRPFYPFDSANPFLGFLTGNDVYLISSIAFIPAILIYLFYAVRFKKKD